MSLFGTDYGVGGQEVDDTQIVQVLLYYDQDEAKEFKRLCKIGIKALYPKTFQDENISDFILKLLKETYAQTKVETADEAATSGNVEGDISGGKLF